MFALGAIIDGAHEGITSMTQPTVDSTDIPPTFGVVVFPVAGALGVFRVQLLCVGTVSDYAEGVGLRSIQGHGTVPGVVWDHGLFIGIWSRSICTWLFVIRGVG